MKCSDCGIEGIHACLGKPVKQEDLPEGVLLVNSVDNVKNYYCKSCGGFIEYDKSIVLPSEPPKYKGTCKSCGEICYKLCTDM